MGLNFKILVIWKALSTMPKVHVSATGVMPKSGGFGSAGSKAAPVATQNAASVAPPKNAPNATSSAAPKAAPPAPTKTVKLCPEFRESRTPCKRKHCWDAECCKAKASAPVASPEHSAPAKSAGGDGGVSAQLSAMEARLKGHIDSRLKAAEGIVSAQVESLTTQVATGFTETKNMMTAQQQATLGMTNALEALMMATASFQSSVNGLITGSASRHELPAPSARPAICASAPVRSSVTEVVEPPFSRGGGSSASEAPGSGRFATSSSDISQSSAACGGSAQSFYREPVPTATSRTSTPKFDAAAARWNVKRNPNNEKILHTIRDTIPDDNMQCLLLALVNGKTYSEITNMYDKDVASLLSTRNTSFFQNFFAALSSCGLPPNFDVKVDATKTKSRHGFVMTYLQLSQAPGNVDGLVTILRGE